MNKPKVMKATKVLKITASDRIQVLSRSNLMGCLNEHFKFELINPAKKPTVKQMKDWDVLLKIEEVEEFPTITLDFLADQLEFQIEDTFEDSIHHDDPKKIAMTVNAASLLMQAQTFIRKANEMI